MAALVRRDSTFEFDCDLGYTVSEIPGSTGNAVLLTAAIDEAGCDFVNPTVAITWMGRTSEIAIVR